MAEKLPQSSWWAKHCWARAHNLWAVYRLTFKDGSTYIGCTRWIHPRLTSHKNTWGESFEVEIVFWGSREDALGEEGNRIHQERPSRNKYGSNHFRTGDTDPQNILEAFDNSGGFLGLQPQEILAEEFVM